MKKRKIVVWGVILVAVLILLFTFIPSVEAKTFIKNSSLDKSNILLDKIKTKTFFWAPGQFLDILLILIYGIFYIFAQFFP